MKFRTPLGRWRCLISFVNKSFIYIFYVKSLKLQWCRYRENLYSSTWLEISVVPQHESNDSKFGICFLAVPFDVLVIAQPSYNPLKNLSYACEVVFVQSHSC